MTEMEQYTAQMITSEKHMVELELAVREWAERQGYSVTKIDDELIVE